MQFTYKTSGVCSRSIDIEIEENKVKSVKYLGGCNGNTKGISSLVVGMDVDEVIKRLKGIGCNGRPTSCPDQLARALERYKIEMGD
jgi:uncharacterized protein (TIGR03905 family)